LRPSELQRAREVRDRKFGAPAADAAERARQMRFLIARGFTADVVREVVSGREGRLQ
jgi:regulatory protein